MTLGNVVNHGDTSSVRNPTHTYIASGVYSGVYNVSLTISDTYASKTKTRIGYITVYASPTANAGADVSVCSGTCTPLNGSAGGTPPYTYEWNPPRGLSDPSITNPVACPDTTTIYTLIVRDANGCLAEDQVVVTVYPALAADFLGTPAIGC
ncbi:MAG: hypothetical protein QME81_18290, partial [bacterium]|nr:hypothetical protein [bacterium]